MDAVEVVLLVVVVGEVVDFEVVEVVEVVAVVEVVGVEVVDVVEVVAVVEEVTSEMTETVSSQELATKTSPLAESYAMPRG